MIVTTATTTTTMIMMMSANRQRHRSRSHNKKYGLSETYDATSGHKPIHISNPKVPSKDQRCPEVGLGIPKPTSGHQEPEVSRQDPRCPEVGIGTPKPTSGHQELQHDASSKDIAPSKITTIGTPKKRNPTPTSGHQELVGDPRARKERTKSRSKNMRRHTYSAARTKTMQNQCFFKGPIHTSNSKVSSKDRRCPEVKLGIPKLTSGHQEVPGPTTRSEVSRG